MNRRFTSGILCLLFFCLGLVAGQFHDHHNQCGKHLAPTSQHNCAACAWQHIAVTDIPTVSAAEVSLPLDLSFAEGPVVLTARADIRLPQSCGPPLSFL